MRKKRASLVFRTREKRGGGGHLSNAWDPSLNSPNELWKYRVQKGWWNQRGTHNGLIHRGLKESKRGQSGPNLRGREKSLTRFR